MFWRERKPGARLSRPTPPPVPRTQPPTRRRHVCVHPLALTSNILIASNIHTGHESIKMPPATPNTLNLILAHLTKFLTIAIHHILATRACYPPSTFLSARAYNLPVRQNRHPGVCDWINAAVSAVRAQLASGAVQNVVLAIHHPVSCALLERFVFDMSRLPPVPRGELDTPIVRNGTAPSPSTADARMPGGAREAELSDLLEQFRGALSAVSSCAPRLREIPRGCTFTLAVELKDEAEAPIGHPMPWVPVEPGEQRGAEGFALGEREGDGLYDSPVERARKGKGRTVPLRSVEAGEVVFEMWVEEGVAKKDLTEADFEETPPASFERLG